MIKLHWSKLALAMSVQAEPRLAWRGERIKRGEHQREVDKGKVG